MSHIREIMQMMRRTENLALLAEEAAELAHAALKLRRTLEPEAAPTPVTVAAAEAALAEEIADVLLCIDMELAGKSLDGIGEMMLAKRERLATRLRAREAMHGAAQEDCDNDGCLVGGPGKDRLE